VRVALTDWFGFYPDRFLLALIRERLPVLVAVAFHPARQIDLAARLMPTREGSCVKPGSSRSIGSGNWLRFSSASKIDERLKHVRAARQEHWELGTEALVIPSLERRQGRQNSD
jgi:hypothetical protein